MPSLPVGFRFQPTDQEIIILLEKKVKGELVVHDSVLECDIYGEEEPWLMFNKNAKDDVYVFTKLKSKSKSMIQRTAGCGTWLGQRSEEIYNNRGTSDDDHVIGFKKLFIFSAPGKQISSRENGHWIMHEFSIAGGGSDHEQQNNDHQYVVCRIRNKDMDKAGMNILTRSEFEDIMRISGAPLTLLLQDNTDSREDTADDKEETRPRKRVRHDDDVNTNVATDQGAQECERILSREKLQTTDVIDLEQEHEALPQQQQLQADPLALMTMGQQLEFYQQQNHYFSHELIDSSLENQYLSYLNWNNPAYANLQNDPHGFYEPAVHDLRPLMALPPPMNVINNNGHPQGPYLAEISRQSPDHHQLPAFPDSFSFGFGIPSQEVAMNRNSFMDLNPISFSQDNQFGADTAFCAK